jgi:glycosyltransferase involved in cell wall biosynthesis
LEWPVQEEEMVLYFDLPEDFAALRSVLQYIGVVRIHFHHLLGHVPGILSLPSELKLPYDYTLHDYYPVCPQYQMTDNSGRYCGEPEEAACDRCLTERPSEWGWDIASWRKRFETFLAAAQRVIAPSRDAAARVEHHINVPNLQVLPHPEQVSMPASVQVRRKPMDSVKVLVLGRLTAEKGACLLRDCALQAKRNGDPLFFRLLGYSTIPLVEEDTVLSLSGEYRNQDLPLLIQLERADIVFFPALWPETYSYTLSAAINSGLPIAAPNLGAFPERLADHPAALLKEWDTSPEVWNAEILQFVERLSIH